MRTREIIIATPEKLDFALRSDPSLIDDVGLIVLDEGHMIGPSEREIRYETLVQRLLRRADASERRIVCLSAILPSGDELNDLTAWIRSDEPGRAGAIRLAPDPAAVRRARLARPSDACSGSTSTTRARSSTDSSSRSQRAGRRRSPIRARHSHLALFAAWEFAARASGP